MDSQWISVETYSDQEPINGPPIAVRHRVESLDFVDTGQKVSVAIRNGYRDEEIRAYPQETLKILGITVAAYLLAQLSLLVISRNFAPAPPAGQEHPESDAD